MPKDSPSLSAAGKERQMNKFNKFRDNRVRINNSLKGVAGPGGNIILPIDWFIDDVYFIEATEFVEKLLSDEQIIALPFEDKLFTALTAAATRMQNMKGDNGETLGLVPDTIIIPNDADLKAVNAIYMEALPYFEKAHAIKPDDVDTVDFMKSIAFRLRDEPGMMDKYNEYNTLLKQLKGEA